ncbi:gephyrin-like molybdotransferase Glp [Marinoscillum sp.]|uniref:molybdopterin molybdotransferase MoeA n=1 Tax=Marinoscillum sp. TaxID=2024838 RepID=UPI003BAB9EC6
MISIENALQLILNQTVPPKTKQVPLGESLGYALAASIVAPFDLPAFDNSAMDGYALCGLQESYTMVDEVAAGDTSHKSLKTGEAMRIFTGGKVPSNTTAVVMQEQTEASNSKVQVLAEIKANQNIRKQGSELGKGQQVFEPGHYITPATVGLIGSLGYSIVSVFDKPEIRLISTGNELIPPGQSLQPGQIYESNSFAIASALAKYGFECTEKQQVEDDYQKTKDAIAGYLDKSDVLLLSGGISVGNYDYVKKALEENGVQEVFYKVAQKPGKPLYFGRKEDKFVFALPGNPASSLTCFYIYVLPLLNLLNGAEHRQLPRLDAPLDNSFELKGTRPAFLKARLTKNEVTILDGQSSSMIHSMALANALVYLKEPGTYAPGQLVECVIL